MSNARSVSLTLEDWRRAKECELRLGYSKLTCRIDIDELFDNPGPAKTETVSPAKPKVAVDVDKKPDFANDPDFILPPSADAKPKPGRLISNLKPLEDFKRVTSSGDVFRKAIQDMGVVVKENVAASFSKQAFPGAIACLEEARSTALMYEESETYNK